MTCDRCSKPLAEEKGFKASLIVLTSGELKTYHEFKDKEKLLKHIEHHLDDAKVVIILKRCKREV